MNCCKIKYLLKKFSQKKNYFSDEKKGLHVEALLKLFFFFWSIQIFSRKLVCRMRALRKLLCLHWKMRLSTPALPVEQAVHLLLSHCCANLCVPICSRKVVGRNSRHCTDRGKTYNVLSATELLCGGCNLLKKHRKRSKKKKKKAEGDNIFH